MARLRDLVVRPRSFFEAKAANPSLTGPIAVAALLGATFVARVLLFVHALGDVATELEAGDDLVYAVGRLVVAAPRDLSAAVALVAVLFFVGWALAAAAIYAVSLYFDGEGSFRRLFALVGWGQLPALVPAALATGYAAVAILGAPELTTQAAAEQWLRSTFRESAVRMGIEYLTPLFALWQAFLWLLAAEYGRELTCRQALVAIAVPAGLLVLNSAGIYLALLQ